MVDLILVRCIAAIPTCLALLAAFVLAPFEHVHPGYGYDDHEHSAIIHAHFGHVPAPVAQPAGLKLVSPDEDDEATSVNTFTSVSPVVLTLVFVPQTPVAIFEPSESFGQADVIEERAHDPPLGEPSIPRAPPS